MHAYLPFIYLLTVEAKDSEVKRLLEMKDLDLEEMKETLKKQERERHSELLKLQMEVMFREIYYVNYH